MRVVVGRQGLRTPLRLAATQRQRARHRNAVQSAALHASRPVAAEPASVVAAGSASTAATSDGGGAPAAATQAPQTQPQPQPQPSGGGAPLDAPLLTRAIQRCRSARDLDALVRRHGRGFNHIHVPLALLQLARVAGGGSSSGSGSGTSSSGGSGRSSSSSSGGAADEAASLLADRRSSSAGASTSGSSSGGSGSPHNSSSSSSSINSNTDTASSSSSSSASNISSSSSSSSSGERRGGGSSSSGGAPALAASALPLESLLTAWLAARAAALHTELDAQGVANALYALAARGAYHPAAVEALCAAAARTADLMSPQHLATAAWALARLGAVPSDGLLRRLLANVLARQRDAAVAAAFSNSSQRGAGGGGGGALAAADLAMLLWALPRLAGRGRVRPHVPARLAGAAAAVLRAGRATPAEAATMLGGLARCGASPSAAWLDAFYAATGPRLRTELADARSLASLGVALGQAGPLAAPPPGEWLRSLAAAAEAAGVLPPVSSSAEQERRGRLDAATAAETAARLLHGLSKGVGPARLGAEGDALVVRLMAAAVPSCAEEDGNGGGGEQQQQQQGVEAATVGPVPPGVASLLLASAARLRARPSRAWLSTVLSAARARFAAPGGAPAQEASEALWALAALGARPSEAWMAAALHALAGALPNAEATHLAAALTALRQLRYAPGPAFWAAVWASPGIVTAAPPRALSQLLAAAAALQASPPQEWARQAVAAVGQSLQAEEVASLKRQQRQVQQQQQQVEEQAWLEQPRWSDGEGDLPPQQQQQQQQQEQAQQQQAQQQQQHRHSSDRGDEWPLARLSATLASLARLNGAPSDRWLAAVERAVLRRVEAEPAPIEPRVAARLIWGIGHLSRAAAADASARPGAAFAGALLANARAPPPAAFGARDLAAALAGLAKLGAGPGPAWMAAAVERAAGLLPAMDARTFQVTVCSFAALRASYSAAASAAWCAALLAALPGAAPRLGTDGVRQLLIALAALRLPPPTAARAAAALAPYAEAAAAELARANAAAAGPEGADAARHLMQRLAALAGEGGAPPRAPQGLAKTLLARREAHLRRQLKSWAEGGAQRQKRSSSSSSSSSTSRRSNGNGSNGNGSSTNGSSTNGSSNGSSSSGSSVSSEVELEVAAHS